MWLVSDPESVGCRERKAISWPRGGTISKWKGFPFMVDG